MDLRDILLVPETSTTDALHVIPIEGSRHQASGVNRTTSTKLCSRPLVSRPQDYSTSRESQQQLPSFAATTAGLPTHSGTPCHNPNLPHSTILHAPQYEHSKESQESVQAQAIAQMRAKHEALQQINSELCRQNDILKKALRKALDGHSASKAVEVKPLSSHSADPNANDLAPTEATPLQFAQETKDSVKKGQWRIGQRRKGTSRKGALRWLPEEIAELSKLVNGGEKNWDVISRKLGRSVGSCQTQSSKSGFLKSKKQKKKQLAIASMTRMPEH